MVTCSRDGSISNGVTRLSKKLGSAWFLFPFCLSFYSVLDGIQCLTEKTGGRPVLISAWMHIHAIEFESPLLLT